MVSLVLNIFQCSFHQWNAWLFYFLDISMLTANSVTNMLKLISVIKYLVYKKIPPEFFCSFLTFYRDQNSSIGHMSAISINVSFLITLSDVIWHNLVQWHKQGISYECRIQFKRVWNLATKDMDKSLQGYVNYRFIISRWLFDTIHV